MLRYWFLAAVLFPITAMAGDFTVGKAPSWVAPAPLDLASTPRKDPRWGIDAILDDHQVRVGATTTHYYRRVRRIVSSTGVQNASELSLDFDPSYQRLIIHEIAVIRNGRKINALDVPSIRVIEKEDEAGNHLYDGMLTAVAVVSDVRTGDLLDYSWSLQGANPLLGGRYADTWDVTAEVPTRLLRHRLLLPRGRTLHSRSTLAPSLLSAPAGQNGLAIPQSTQGDDDVYVWERHDVPAIDADDHTPDWFDAYDHVQVSEFGSWHDIALWADALFTLDDASKNAIRDLAATIRRAHPNRSDQILSAIRFVQDDIRYLGIEMGRNSHEPHQPAAVLHQRWGDCKDKSFLLASLLRELGVDAAPALVNTRLQHSMDAVLPSPFEFDHVITAVKNGGATRWIDPTLADQGGTLDTIETPDDERALVVSKGTTSLTKVVTNQKGTTSIALAYSAHDWNGPTRLIVRSTRSGADADRFRSDLASMSAVDLARERINRLAGQHPHIVAIAPIAIADDRTRNVITVVESYEVRGIWTADGWSYEPHIIADHLARPDTILRTTPLAFDFPLDVTERATFDLPPGATVSTGDSVEDTPAFRYERHVTKNGNSIAVTYRLVARKDAIVAGSVPDHLTRVNQILDAANVTIDRSKPVLASIAPGTGNGVIALALIAGVVIGAFAFRRPATPE